MAILNRDMSKLTDRLINTDNQAAIQAYESKLEKLESQKVLIEENLTKPITKTRDFDKSFRTAMNFLANPWNLWVSPNIEARKAVLRMVFAAPLPYVRNQGFRTAKATSPFKALRAFLTMKKKWRRRSE